MGATPSLVGHKGLETKGEAGTGGGRGRGKEKEVVVERAARGALHKSRKCPRIALPQETRGSGR